MNNIILIGFMGSGKTTIGKKIAEFTGMNFLDTDALIEQEQGITINEIFASKGEKAFRDMERAMVKKLTAEGVRGIFSVGGGLPVQPGNAELLKQLGIVVYLNAQKETLIQRLQNDTTRPLLAGGSLEEKIDTLMKQREALYVSASDVIIETDGMSVEEAARQIIEMQEVQ